MTREQALQSIAHHAVASTLTVYSKDHSDYPDLTDQDWEEIAQIQTAIADDLWPDGEAYVEAYKLLTGEDEAP